MLKKKFLVLPMLMGMAGLFLVGQPSLSKITLTLWTHPNPAYVAVQEHLVQAFEEEYPDIKIKYEVQPQIDEKILPSFAAGTIADIVEYYGSTTKYAKAGVILPVPEWVKSKKEIEEEYLSQVLPNRLWEGKYYGIAEEINIESPGLLIRRDLLEKAGLSIPESWYENYGPKTWEELIEFGRKLTIFDERGNIKQIGLGMFGSGYGGERLSSLIWQLGGDYRDAENKVVHFDTAEGRGAIEFLRKYGEGPDRVHDAYSTGWYDAFFEGNEAMAIAAPWVTAVIDQNYPDIKYEYFNRPPFIKGSKPYFVAEGGWGMFVAKASKNPKEAWQYVKFTLRAENHLYWAKTVGSVPSRKELKNDPYFQNSRLWRGVFQILPYGKELGAYMLDTFTVMWGILPSEVGSILLGEKNAEQGLRDMERRINQLIEELYEKW